MKIITDQKVRNAITEMVKSEITIILQHNHCYFTQLTPRRREINVSLLVPRFALTFTHC